MLNESEKKEDEAFIKTIRRAKEDRTVRFIYADWLEERDDERGELIRIEEEVQSLTIVSDRYWELKPRRRELLGVAPKPWLKKMEYGDTKYQPVFGDIPTGWKERWRLLREFIERWYRVPMNDVGGPLMPVAPRNQWADQSVDDVMGNPNRNHQLPPSLREWMFFVRELDLRLPDFAEGNGYSHIFEENAGRLFFFQLEGGHEHIYVRAEDRDRPDPPVWRMDRVDWPNPHPLLPLDRRGRPYTYEVGSHLTTMMLSYLLFMNGPGDITGDVFPCEESLTEDLTRRLKQAFPVHSQFDETHIFERENAFVAWSPQSVYWGERPIFQLKARSRTEHDRACSDIFD
jgi:uncharacterized protein (TIGR02996 family)